MIEMALDIETYDPDLKKKGSGSIAHNGHIIGIGVYSDKPIVGNQNKVWFTAPLKPLRDLLSNPNVIKICHNGVYDLDWLCNGPYHLEVNGRCEDTMTRETLIDAYRSSYSLDNCCIAHNLEGKYKGGIETWWKDHGGKGKVMEHLDQIPSEIVGEYCLKDCEATFNLYQSQKSILEREELTQINDCECDLYPVVLEMRRNGIRIDQSNLTKLDKILAEEYGNNMTYLENKYGIFPLSLSRSLDLQNIFKQENIPFKYTEKGRPSFTTEVLQDCTHPVAALIQHTRALQKLRSTFLEVWPTLLVNGRLHTTLYPSKRDVGGTITGRWSSQNPNLQQVPARGDKHGEECRSLFIPDEGCSLGAFDYKQIEYRVFLHFAVGEEAKKVQKMFCEDHDIDYHQMTVDMLGWNEMGKEGRHLAKCLNFGVLYGLGVNSFATRFKHALLDNHPERTPNTLKLYARALMEEYYQKVPFIRPTISTIEKVGAERGYVKTVLGRRQRRPPDKKDYKLVNYLIQGTASDIINKALVDGWKAGVFKVLKLHFPVHDEIVFSIPQTRQGYEACIELKHIMTSVFQLQVPLGIDTEIGPDWGHCSYENFRNFEKRCGQASQL